MSASGQSRIPVLYVAPWVDYGGTDKGTIDWFRWLDRDRFAPSLVTTQPSANRRVSEVVPYASEVWNLPDMLRGEEFPLFTLDFIHSRGVRVVHLMNSRLGFDLLPDLRALPRPPTVVVQLHVEEEDRSGYIRYVTTRYGNLVDAFSVTSQQLAESIMSDYEVPRGKCYVIYTGVDADQEFSPSHVPPLECLGEDVTHILYPGRLVEQKDPLLMVEIASILRERGLAFRMHSIGEGPLESDIRKELAARGLEDHVLVHGSVPDAQRWYASCELVLMTSRFEGVPYVLFEAMAMEVPVVAPALPGIVELLGDESGITITPRDDACAYADAVTGLIDNPQRRRAMGVRARQRVRQEFSLQGMARAHENLYETLLERDSAQQRVRLGDSQPGGHEPPDRAPLEDPILFHARASRGKPLVSVVVPCFNHGQWLPACLESIRCQTYPALETIVVDDGSFEEETVEVLQSLEHDPGVTLVRLAENGGPSIARNAGVAKARGRYVLPVDADNLLLPSAVEDLVEQLQGAGEQIGYIYPNLQYFGNRTDYFEAPAYNLHALMKGNFCDTCSLLDRTVFDRGLEYAEDIRLGHEDWDFVLQLAEREVYGKPARSKTLRYRKHGFTRSDTVAHQVDAFHRTVEDRHPRLHAQGVAIKARWAPALSIIALDVIDPEHEAGMRLLSRLVNQSCPDVELLARLEDESPRLDSVPQIRRIPAELASGAAEALADGVGAARGRYLLVTRGTGSSVLADPAFVEKVLRSFWSDKKLDAIAFTDAGENGRFTLRLILPEDDVQLQPHAVAWAVNADRSMSCPLPDGMRDDEIVPALAGTLNRGARTQWRHLPAPTPGAENAPSSRREIGRVELSGTQPARTAERAERRERLTEVPFLPHAPRESFRRFTGALTWVPPLAQILCRHLDPTTGMRVVNNDRQPPPGFVLEHDLGAVNRFPLQGTAPLGMRGEAAEVEYVVGEDFKDAESLGYLEAAPLPMLEPLQLATHRVTGQRVLIAGPDDPLIGVVDPLATLGRIDLFPINPRRLPEYTLMYGVGPGLVRSVDRRRRRHRYALGSIPAGDVAGELGSLVPEPDGSNTVPVWLTSGGDLITDAYRPAVRRPGIRVTARWVLAPAAWGDLAARAARARAIARRALGSLRYLVRPARELRPESEPVGYLFRNPGPERLALFAGTHPVTGDQLLSLSPLEIKDMGYGEALLLGYLVARAPTTGQLGVRTVPVPWASRFGEVALTQ